MSSEEGAPARCPLADTDAPQPADPASRAKDRGERNTFKMLTGTSFIKAELGTLCRTRNQ